MKHRDTDRAAIAVEVVTGTLQDCSQHSHRPEGCIRTAAELDRLARSKTGTDGHSRRNWAAEQDRQELGRSRSRSIQA